MAQVAVAVDFVKSFSGDIDPTTQRPGPDRVVRGTAILLMPEAIPDFFNIPIIKIEETTNAVVQIDGFAYQRFDGLGDAAGKEITVQKFERMARVTRSAKNVVRLQMKGKQTSRKKLRTTSIRFPGFFTLPMIAQAIGSMIKTNEPTKFMLDRTGKSYPLVPNTSSGLLPNRLTGAWVSTSVEKSTNADDTTAPANPIVETRQPRGKANNP